MHITLGSHANGIDLRQHLAFVRVRTELIRGSKSREHGSVHATSGGRAGGDEAWKQTTTTDRGRR